MMQFELFAFALAEQPAVAVAAIGEPWLSDDVAERAAFARRSAAFWQRYHDASGLPYTVDGFYAAELLRMAADMEADAEYYRSKPAHRSDMQWFRAKGGQA